MAGSVILTKRASGAYQIEVKEGEVTQYTKPFASGTFTVQYNSGNDNTPKIKLVPPVGEEKIMLKFHAPEEWTVGVATGYTTVEEVADAIMALSNT